jgi:plasmid stabilization system protein ParE
MARAPAKHPRRLSWTPSALAEYERTLSFIATDDPLSAERIKERTERALATVLAFPHIGALGARRGERRLPIPNTGHVLNYRVLRSEIRVQSWYRARRRPPEDR